MVNVHWRVRVSASESQDGFLLNQMMLRKTNKEALKGEVQETWQITHASSVNNIRIAQNTLTLSRYPI